MNILESAEKVEAILDGWPNRVDVAGLPTAIRMALAVAIHDAYELGRRDGAREPLPLINGSS